jgi:predicted Zn-dependent peptidase
MNDDVVIIKKAGFKKILLKFIYVCPKNIDEVVSSSILVRTLLEKTKKYPTKEDFLNAQIEHYILAMHISKYYGNDNLCFIISVAIPDKEILQDSEYSYKDTIKFIIDSIYNPDIKNNAFLEEDVSKSKRKIKNAIISNINEIKTYSGIRLEEIIAEDDYFNYDLFNHKDEIDDVDNKSLYTYFKDVIETKRPYIFAIGNIDDSFKNIINDEIDSNLKRNDFSKKELKPFSNVSLKVIEEKKDYSQSIIKFAYKIPDYQKEDIKKLILLENLLNSQSSNILFEYLRTKENLVYTAGAQIIFEKGLLIINALIYKDKKEKTINTIKQVMELLHDEEFIENRLENIKERKRINLERQKDSMASVLEDFIYTYFDYCITLEKEYEYLKDVKAADVVKFVNRLQLDAIYYLEGTRND